MAERWHIYVKGRYLGTCTATETEIHDAFPWANIYVIGHAVEVWAPGIRIFYGKGSNA